MARRLGKVHMTRGAPKLSTPALGPLADAMAAALAQSADIEEPSIMSEVGKYASVLRFDGGPMNTKVY